MGRISGAGLQVVGSLLTGGAFGTMRAVGLLLTLVTLASTMLAAACGSASGSSGNSGSASSASDGDGSSAESSSSGGSSTGGGSDGGSGSGSDSGGSPSGDGPDGAMLGNGLTNCGAASEPCSASLTVTGGTFDRTYANDGTGATGLADPATVGTFRLDKYLVTVGRFRQFVAAWNGGAGYAPPPGSGKHAPLNGGSGLNATAGGYEAGWVAADNGNIPPTDANLACGGSSSTWTSSVWTSENLPINCVNWYEAYAFCIWDGGFLPSQAEWEYAAAGGSQQLEYPWGSTDPGTGSQYAIYPCYYPNGSGTCTGLENIAPVGAATLGVATWGQLDMAGELYEWTLGWNWTPPDPCTNCEVLGAFGTPPARAVESSPFIFFGSAHLPTPFGHSGAPAEHFYVEGVR